MKFKIAVIPGDGIGPEIVAAAQNVMEGISEKFGHEFEYEEVLLGGVATDACGKSYPDGTAERCKACDAVLLGAVGTPKYGSDKPAEQRPETALLAIRKDLGLFVNLRPAMLRPALVDTCPLRKETAEKGIDLIICRELTGGVYFGKRDRYQTEDRGEEANVLSSSRLWREVMHRLAAEYPDVEFEDMLVDNTAMQLVKNPSQFDVVVTENMFGDILSDEASMLAGSLGMLPSASLGATAPGLYEPSHGSAPKYAGLDKANPIATILSVAMMFKYSLNLPTEAQAIEDAVDAVLAEGWHTYDIPGSGEEVGTKKMGQLIREHL